MAQLHALSRRATYHGLIPDAVLREMTGDSLRPSWALRVAREAGTHALLVAEAAGQLRGFSYLGPGDEIERVPPDTGVLYALHVHPDAVGTGVGRALMLVVLREFAARRHTRAVLWVLEGNHRARRFYEKGGWHPDGTVRESAIGTALTRQLRYVRPVRDGPHR